MKNTLAENMLRFGVKNLKESDVKRIEELSEAFTAKDQSVWPHFKDQAAVDKFTALTIGAGAINDKAIFTAIFGGTQEATTRMGTFVPQQFTNVFWHSEALNPNSQGFAVPGAMAQTKGIINRGYQATFDYSSKWSRGMPVNEVLKAVNNADNEKWWDTQIEYPAGTKQTRWQLFSKTYLMPTLANLKPLFVAGTPTPAADQMQPGTQPKQ